MGANALLACIFSGLIAGDEVPRYIDSTSFQEESKIFEHALQLEEELKQDLLGRQGPENIYLLYDEMADWMTRHVTVKRDNQDLQATLTKLKELKERYKHITLDDRTQFANQTYIFANEFGPMLELALVITKGALLRNESRGAHFKPEFPVRDDEIWLKTTLATYDPIQDEPLISYQPIDLRHLKPIHRDYTQAKKVKPTLENIPMNLTLPV